jgi:RNA polymerase sigma-70 factor (ECF subfamily)
MLGLTNPEEARALTDEEVLARASGEPWLFSLLLERYQDAFLRKARTVIRDERDAEEVVQDAFVKIYVHAHSFTPQAGAKFSSWAYRILLNTAFTRYQKLRKEGERFLPAAPELLELLAENGGELTADPDRDAIERVLARLPDALSHVLRLHYLERWSHRDIGASLGEGEGAVKARIHRAKAAFRKALRGGEAETML